MRNGFIFYRDRCVGCEACVVACNLENGVGGSLAWRTVYQLNASHLFGKPTRFWSLACNHCSEASCMQACPAGAFSRDPGTGAVLLHANACIGCTYCEWACPYDVPVYSFTERTMSKCTLCIHRIKEGKEPACITGCPVGALDFGPVTDEERKEMPQEFITTNLDPSLKVITGKPERETVTSYTFLSEAQKTDISGTQKGTKRLTFKKEWPLYIFTLLIPLMLGMLARGMVGSESWVTWAFLISAITAGMASLSHLGRKKNAWRAVLNIKSSWLSREISGFILMTLTGTLFFIFPQFLWLAWIAVTFGVITLIAIDQVYAYARNKYTFLFHSSNVLLTGFLWVSLAWLQPRPILFIGTLKIFFTILSVFVIHKNRPLPHLVVSLYALRLLCTAGAVTYLFTGPAYLPYLFALFMVGEMADRFLFYSEQELVSLRSHFLTENLSKISK